MSDQAVLVFRDPRSGTLRRVRLSPKALDAMIEHSELITEPGQVVGYNEDGSVSDDDWESDPPAVHLRLAD